MTALCGATKRRIGMISDSRFMLSEFYGARKKTWTQAQERAYQAALRAIDRLLETERRP